MLDNAAFYENSKDTCILTSNIHLIVVYYVLYNSCNRFQFDATAITGVTIIVTGNLNLMNNSSFYKNSKVLSILTSHSRANGSWSRLNSEPRADCLA